MTEFILGFMVGVVFMGILEAVYDYRKRIKRTVELEKEHALLEQHVAKAVGCIDNIIHGSKP
jgi:hypothetical protein